jgi:hypothetical protein
MHTVKAVFPGHDEEADGPLSDSETDQLAALIEKSGPDDWGIDRNFSNDEPVSAEAWAAYPTAAAAMKMVGKLREWTGSKKINVKISTAKFDESEGASVSMVDPGLLRRPREVSEAEAETMRIVDEELRDMGFEEPGPVPRGTKLRSVPKRNPPTMLTPNDPRKRFEHVIKTYWGKSYKGESLDGAVLDAFYVTSSLVGAHDVPPPERIISHEPGTLGVKFRMDEINVERVQKSLDYDMDFEERSRERGQRPPEPPVLPRVKAAKAAREMLARLDQPYAYKNGIILWDGAGWGLADLVYQTVKLPEHSPPDFLIPWVARELVKLAKAVIDGGPRSSRRTGATALSTVERLREAGTSHSDYWDAVHTLYDKAPAIAQWSKETRTDIGKVDLATALEAIATYKFKESLVEQGTIVYRYKDGWTVQELRTETALTQEGKQMQNCIGGYCEDVERGDTRIYSVRDASGQPHVSMELKVPPGPSNYGSELSAEKFVASPERLRWHFEQILGKQNDMPIDEYRERAREFIDKVFAKEGLGWCLTGGTPKWGRFAGRDLSYLNFPDIIGTNHVGEDAFTGADFTGATLARCVFGTIDMSHTNFDRADLTEASLAHTRLNNASFEGTKCYFTNFSSANCADASFDSAHLGGAKFDSADLIGTNFRDAKIDGASFIRALGTGANWEGVELTAVQKDQLGMRAHWAIAAGGRRT